VEEVWEYDVCREMVQEIGEIVLGMAKRAVEKGRGAKTEIELAEAKYVSMPGRHCLVGLRGEEKTYAGEVSFRRRASSAGVRTPCSRNNAARAKRASVARDRRDWVTTKIL